MAQKNRPAVAHGRPIYWYMTIASLVRLAGTGRADVFGVVFRVPSRISGNRADKIIARGAGLRSGGV